MIKNLHILLQINTYPKICTQFWLIWLWLTFWATLYYPVSMWNKICQCNCKVLCITICILRVVCPSLCLCWLNEIFSFWTDVGLTQLAIARSSAFRFTSPIFRLSITSLIFVCLNSANLIQFFYNYRRQVVFSGECTRNVEFRALCKLRSRSFILCVTAVSTCTVYV